LYAFSGNLGQILLAIKLDAKMIPEDFHTIIKHIGNPLGSSWHPTFFWYQPTAFPSVNIPNGGGILSADTYNEEKMGEMIIHT